MMQNHPTHAAALTAITYDSLTALPFTLAAAAYEEAHSLAAEAVCDPGEWAMRDRNVKRHRGQRAARRLASLLALSGLAFWAARKAGAR